MGRVWGCYGLVMLMGLVLCGCLTVEDQARMNELIERIPKLEARVQSIRADIAAGKIPLPEGLALIGDTRDLISDAKAERDYLKSKDYRWWEIVGGIITSVVLSLGGVKAWRGGVHDRKGESPS